ncbi:MAG: hypothetical protein PWP02_193 [Thermosipho sp. (in: thermotogales)]|nr:hypothetical protein [Thermosipho sp. (in: thermotogales)]
MKPLFVLAFLILILSTAFSFDLLSELSYDIKTIKLGSESLVFLPTFFLDEVIQNKFREEHPFFIASFVNDLDEFDFLFLTLGLSGISAYNDSYMSFSIIESAVLTTFATYALKFIIGRARPNFTNSPFVFKPFNLKNEFNSFPSGHSAIAWALFTPIAEKYNKLIYLIPAIFSISRVLGNYHWTSDVIFGAIIGYTFGKNVYINKSVP